MAALAQESIATGTAATTRIALLGTGTVGRAVLARLTVLADTAHAAANRWQLVHVANSRHAVRSRFGLDPAQLLGALDAGEGSDLSRVDGALLGADVPVLIDATASAEVAARHAHWLGQGIHVITACKLAQGSAQSSWHALRQAQASAGTVYGDSATVGAGLPVLSSIRALRAGGDRIHAIAGALSGSLAWLFDDQRGQQPFSGRVRDAHRAGYTEPDPRDDLSGADVLRKLLILARSAGIDLEPSQVDVESLLPATLRDCRRDELDAALTCLDAPMHQRQERAQHDGGVLRHVARVQADGHARVGLEQLPPDDALAHASGTDNSIAIWSDRYASQPLVIRGPGAGADVTAAALIDDLLAIQRRHGRRPD